MRGLLRIGQVSKLYGISLDTLRHYDRKGLLEPIVDSQSGYRYYSLEHLDILEMILVGKFTEIPLDQMKEKIDSESINGYMSMMQEQSSRIYEKQKILNQLGQYTEGMLELLQTIAEFQNDYSFSSVAINKEMNLTIYNVDLQTLLGENTISHQIDGMESFEQWFSYYVEVNGIIVENGETIGLSVLDNMINTNILQRSLEFTSKSDFVSRHHIAGCYGSISFWGTQKDLMEYLYELCRHFNLRDTVLLIKFRFALPHKSMEHEYFVEIYFPHNPA
ncbi:MAG: MerR family DNA-binding transcriptional regulator [Lachnospiraceae bacterium]|nr:MerR family DNA-binding transcriptional regulator [Lachnospiraceae bacterium]